MICAHTRGFHTYDLLITDVKMSEQPAYWVRVRINT